MSTQAMALDRNAAVESPTVAPHTADDEYALLIEQLRQLENKYKLGDVDEEITDEETGKKVWAFEAALNEVEQLVSRHKERLMAERPSRFYRFLAIQAEAKDYFDTATPSDRLDLYQMALKLYRQLPKRVAPDAEGEESEERRTLKNIVRIIIAGLEYLHTTSEFGVAIAYAQGLYEFVSNSGLSTKTDQAFAEKAVICYFLGRTHRQRGIDDDYRLAIDYFYQCNDYYFAEARRDTNKNEEVIYARTRAAVSLAFGAGFLYFNAQSDLAQAKGLIAQARHAFLKDNGDIRCKHHYNYLELLYASILRAEAGELLMIQSSDGAQAEAEQTAAKDKLDSALEILERCQAALMSKPNYYIHLLYNKVLVYLFQGPQKYSDARECIAELMRRCQDSPRWHAHALILRSRLERRLGNADAALADGLRALNQAGSNLPVRIEALFARGEAQLDRNNLSAARADFEKAYQLSSGANKKQEVMALILLAEVALAEQRPQLALEKFAQAKTIIPSISHGFILSRYHRLEAQLKDYQADFVIRGDVSDLEYETHERALRCWLLKKALCEDRSLTSAARRLNISKKTAYQWRDTYKIKT
jgi:hypothetical protein